MDEAELARVQRLVHSLVCRDRMSAELASERLTAYSIRRSAAEIGRDLEAASCQHCSARPAQQAGQAEPEPVQSVHHPAVQSGWLTGMIGRG